jgi:hypothetical protein
MGNQWHRILSIQAGYGHTVALTGLQSTFKPFHVVFHLFVHLFACSFVFCSASNIVLGAGGNWAGQLGPSSSTEGINQPFFAPILDLTVDTAQLMHVTCGPNSTIESRRSDEGTVIVCLRRRRVECLCTSEESVFLRDGVCVRSISCGVAHAAAFLADGSVVEFRFPEEEEAHNEQGEHVIIGTILNVENTVAAAACGDDFTYIATDVQGN